MELIHHLAGQGVDLPNIEEGGFVRDRIGVMVFFVTLMLIMSIICSC